MGFRELLYFRVVGCLVEQGVRLTPEQKREIFTVFGDARRRAVEHGSLGGEQGAALPVRGFPWPWWWSSCALDYAEIQARIPKPPGRQTDAALLAFIEIGQGWFRVRDGC
jgi:hypothetical protein